MFYIKAIYFILILAEIIFLMFLFAILIKKHKKLKLFLLIITTLLMLWAELFIINIIRIDLLTKKPPFLWGGGILLADGGSTQYFPGLGLKVIVLHGYAGYHFGDIRYSLYGVYVCPKNVSIHELKEIIKQERLEDKNRNIYIEFKEKTE